MLRSEHQQRVDEFMRLANQGLPTVPTEPSEEVRLLRAKLIFEECVRELINKGLGVEIRGSRDGLEFYISGPFDMVETVDGCLDAAVVVTGTLSAIGVPDLLFQKLVDENNLAKFGPGHYVADGTPEKPGPGGKLIKPPGHEPPDIAGLLDRISKGGGCYGKLPEPTVAQVACTHERWRNSSLQPRNCLDCGLLMWDAGD